MTEFGWLLEGSGNQHGVFSDGHVDVAWGRQDVSGWREDEEYCSEEPGMTSGEGQPCVTPGLTQVIRPLA